MAIFKCKMCGGDLDISAGMSIAECQYCGTKQTLPKLDDDKKATLYDRANHFRRNNEFDKAMGIYEQILNEDSSDAEAYWSLVLCRYGIEYVEDPASRKRIPTVNRAQFTSIFDDENYKSALQYADGYQKSIYEEEAKAINEIQKGILAISQQEEPFDVFICYKETDANGRRTPDSVLANDLYHQLTQEGFKVFFARITLEDKLGTAYEPYIFAALNSAKVMVVLGTKSEYFNAVWVRNEWSRYLALIKSGAKKMLIPAYKDMDPYDLPEEFAHLQSQDMSKLGFMQDLIRGIKKIASVDEPKTVAREVVQGSGTDKATLLKRAALFLGDGGWKSADEYCEKVLDIDPECAEAYLYKLMADLRVKHRNHLENSSVSLTKNINFNKIIQFGNADLIQEIQDYEKNIHYSYANRLFEQGNYDEARKVYEDLVEYKDASDKLAKCVEALDFENTKRQQCEIALAPLINTQKKYIKSSKLCSISGFSLLMIGTLILILANLSYEFWLGLSIFLPCVIIGGIVFLMGIIVFPILSHKNNKRIVETKQSFGLQNNNGNVRFNPGSNVIMMTDTSSGSSWHDVVLLDAGVNKIQVIAAIRELTGLGLADAKALTDVVPSTVKSSVSTDEASKMKHRLESAGARVNIQ